MRNTFGFIAIMGVLGVMCNQANYFTSILTVLCGILYIFYPSEKHLEEKE